MTPQEQFDEFIKPRFEEETDKAYLLRVLHGHRFSHQSWVDWIQAGNPALAEVVGSLQVQLDDVARYDVLIAIVEANFPGA